MPLCGFNDKMLKGLSDLNEGLVEHGLFYRSKKNNETFLQGVQRELSDMTRLLLEIDNIDDVSKRVLTKGIVLYAMGFYLVCRKYGVNRLEGEYKELISRIGEYFKAMDSKYYDELEGKEDDMKELVGFLNSFVI